MVCLILSARRPTLSRNVCASVSLSGECVVVSHYDSSLNILMAWKKFPLVLITIISQMTSPDLIKRVVPAFNVTEQSGGSLSFASLFKLPLSCLRACHSSITLSLHMVHGIFEEGLGHTGQGFQGAPSGVGLLGSACLTSFFTRCWDRLLFFWSIFLPTFVL